MTTALRERERDINNNLIVCLFVCVYKLTICLLAEVEVGCHGDLTSDTLICMYVNHIITTASLQWNLSLSGHLINGTLSSVPNVIFVYLTTAKMRKLHYSGHFNLTQWCPV